MMSPLWTAPPVSDRVEPDGTAGERAELEGWVEYHRATLLLKCAGLTAEELKRRSVPPSNMSLLGLVRHMTEVERWWFRRHANGDDLEWQYTAENLEGDWEEVDDADAAADLDRFRRECEAARAAVTGKDLDLVVPSRGDHPERTVTIRWIFMHMIEEYARHNGHADLLREAIDGQKGD
jgi:uncharacterized damage-inducible protein DinB